MLNLRQIEIFREVMLSGTTTGAAQVLRISQPAVSNAVRQIESQVGMMLFQRAGNRLIPTPEAVEMFQSSETIFSVWHSFVRKVEGLRTSEAGALNIIATPPLANALLPGVLKEFIRTRPGVQVSVDTRSVDGVLEALETRMADIGFIAAPPKRDNIEAEMVLKGEMVCAFPPDHPLADRTAVTADDLKQYPLVIYAPKSRLNLLLQRSFLTSQMQDQVVAEVRYASLGCILAEAGIGVTIVDSFTAASGDRYRLEWRPLHPRQELQAYALFRKDEQRKKLTEAFMAEVRRWSARQEAEDAADIEP